MAGIRLDGEIEAKVRGDRQPVDVAHLHAQTCGDLDLQREVCALFVGSARALVAELGHMPQPRTPEIAHKLKGSARAIGAFALADLAGRIESGPHCLQILAEIDAELVRVEEFLGSFRR